MGLVTPIQQQQQLINTFTSLHTPPLQHNGVWIQQNTQVIQGRRKETLLTAYKEYNVMFYNQYLLGSYCGNYLYSYLLEDETPIYMKNHWAGQITV